MGRRKEAIIPLTEVGRTVLNLISGGNNIIRIFYIGAGEHSKRNLDPQQLVIFYWHQKKGSVKHV